jgi:hypothetical protein
LEQWRSWTGREKIMSSRTEISHFQELLIGHFDRILNKLSQYYLEIPAKPSADAFEKEW